MKKMNEARNNGTSKNQENRVITNVSPYAHLSVSETGQYMIPGSCCSCRKLKTGNLHHPDGHIEYNVTVCIDRRCEPGLNTYYRPVV